MRGRAKRWSATQRRLRVTAAARESLAAAARADQDWGRADRLYHEALGLYRRLGEKRREAWVLGSLGVVSLSQRLNATAKCHVTLSMG